jgi:4-hydroxybenzoate polyprenyltransferase
MPLVDFYATACDWVPLGRLKPAPGLMWFLLVSLFNGMVIEIGRKIRVPDDEEQGVETYSFLWGRKRAVAVWLAMMTVTGILACRAAQNIGFLAAALTILAVTIAVATVLGLRFLATRTTGAGKQLETLAGVWSLLLYLSLGVLPIALRFWRST